MLLYISYAAYLFPAYIVTLYSPERQRDKSKVASHDYNHENGSENGKWDFCVK